MKDCRRETGCWRSEPGSNWIPYGTSARKKRVRMFQDRDEEILVVPRDRLLVEPVHGFVRGKADVYLARIRDHGVFRPRATVEQDSSFKQIIPYLIVRHAGRLFLSQRSTQGGEGRLHGKYSIGVGGHINRRDVEGAEEVIDAGLRRELEEELLIRGPWRGRGGGGVQDGRKPPGEGPIWRGAVGGGELPRLSA